MKGTLDRPFRSDIACQGWAGEKAGARLGGHRFSGVHEEGSSKIKHFPDAH